jgi:RNA polymerase sigma factor (sigma-70 family)
MTATYEIKCFADDKLNGYAQKLASEIVNDKTKMPFLYSHCINRDDVLMEVSLAFLAIAKTFKEKAGGRALPSYCYQWGKMTAWRNIKRRFSSKAKTIPFEKMDYAVNHLYGESENLSVVVEDARSSIEESDLIDVLYCLADETERHIIRRMLRGYGILAIAEEIGISRQAISKRLRRLGAKFKKLEERALG